MLLSTRGLELRPAQVWGSIRLVPIVRTQPIRDLRMAIRNYGEGFGVADLGKTVYTSYIPHGLVMRWSSDGEVAEVPAETRIGAKEQRKPGTFFSVKRMVRKEARDQLRLLPLHTAMEGFLALQFGGPVIAHRYYSSQVKRFGLSPRIEFSRFGRDIPGLAEALRVFEVHEGQCGVLVFVADGLASASLVAHPDDYLALHQSLIRDFYGELLYRWGWSFRSVPELQVKLEGDSFDTLEASLASARQDWQRFAEMMAGGLFGRDVHAEKMRRAGRFHLSRFLTGDLDTMIDGEHIGEAMLATDGTIAYLKSYRLDRGQVRRARMLRKLGRHDWDLDAIAAEEGHGIRRRIEVDLEQAGLGWILNPGRDQS